MTDHPASFTPGPWEAFPIKADSMQIKTRYGSPDMDQSELCPVMALGTGKNRQANAHLIASAPDLYAALEICREVIEFAYMSAPEQPKEIEIARQALAKARGD